MSTPRYPRPFRGVAVECVECGEVFPEIVIGYECGHIRWIVDPWLCFVDGCTFRIHESRERAVECIRAAAKAKAEDEG